MKAVEASVTGPATTGKPRTPEYLGLPRGLSQNSRQDFRRFRRLH
jgi:hypothetical protein